MFNRLSSFFKASADTKQEASQDINGQTSYVSSFNNDSQQGENIKLTFDYHASVGFSAWLKTTQSSLAFSSYRFNKLFLMGLDEAGELSLNHDSFPHCMGLYANRKRLYLSTNTQVLSFRGWPISRSGKADTTHDRVYVSKAANTVGPLQVHDMACDRTGNLIFVNTACNCLATLSRHNNFKPIWKPPFITKIQMGDRCHLTGLAMVDGHPRYVTAASQQAEQLQEWHDHREAGGCVIDITNDDIILTGLSIPHSPRWHQGKLWLHNSGTGEFGYVADLNHTPKFQPVTVCPGFPRGLTFWQNFAIVGISIPDHRLFKDLAWEKKLSETETEAHCGLIVIDLTSGKTVHWLYFDSQPSAAANTASYSYQYMHMPAIENSLQEIYSVQLIPQVRQPLILGENRLKRIPAYVTHDELVNA